MQAFCLKEFEILLTTQNVSAFTLEEFKSILETRMLKYDLKVDIKKLGYI